MASPLPLFTNNASQSITNSGGISSGDTVITVGDSSVFSEPVTPFFQWLTLDDGANIEIVKMTSNVVGTGTLTVVRAQEGTSALAFAEATPIESRNIASHLENTVLRSPIYSGSTVGDAAVDIVTARTLATHGATGDESIAIGRIASGTGGSSIAIGDSSVALQLSSLAIGTGALADSSKSTAVGPGARCELSASQSVAIGQIAVTVASESIVIGRYADCFGTSHQIAIGADSVAGAGKLNAVVIGSDAEVNGSYSCVLGDSSINSVDYSVSIGYLAMSRVTKTHVISGPSIVRKDNAETDEVMYFSGQENIIFSQEIDFKTIGDNVVTVEVPAGSTFFVTEVGFVPTVVDTPTASPTVEFGSAAVTDAILAATLTTSQTVKKRERYSETLNNTNWISGADEVGHITQLTASVTSAAAATTFLGRVYFKGMLIEDE